MLNNWSISIKRFVEAIFIIRHIFQAHIFSLANYRSYNNKHGCLQQYIKLLSIRAWKIIEKNNRFWTNLVIVGVTLTMSSILRCSAKYLLSLMALFNVCSLTFEGGGDAPSLFNLLFNWSYRTCRTADNRRTCRSSFDTSSSVLFSSHCLFNVWAILSPNSSNRVLPRSSSSNSKTSFSGWQNEKMSS